MVLKGWNSWLYVLCQWKFINVRTIGIHDTRMKCLLWKNCTYDLRNNSLLERPAAPLADYGFRSFQSYGAKIWNLLPIPYTMGVSFYTFKNMIKTWSGPACKCSVCYLLQLDIYDNLINHNCVFVLNWRCGFIWSIMHGYDFCFLHLSENILCYRTANVVLFIRKTGMKYSLSCLILNWHAV